MKLTVGKPLVPEVIPNSYSVEVKVMAGDADYYDNFTVHGFEPGRDDDLLEELLRLFDRIDAFYPHGRGGGSEYALSRIPGFNSWFAPDDYADYRAEYDSDTDYESDDQRAHFSELTKRVELFFERVGNRAKELGLGYLSDPYWPLNAMADIECGHDSHAVYFYDENLVKHEVTVEL